MCNVRLKCVFAILATIGSLTWYINVYADDPGGGGTGGGDVHGSTSCNGCVCGYHYTTSSCSDGTGKASWHIYKISKVANTSGGPKYDPDLLNNDGWNYSNSELRATCPASEFDYYVAFGWDGWNGRNYEGDSVAAKKNVPTHWGPVHSGTYMEADGNKYYPGYNNNDKHTFAQVENAIDNGTDVNGWRLTEGAAETIYRVWKPNATSIPKSIGYFCASFVSEYEGKVEVSGAASGSSPSSGYTQTTQNTKNISADCSDSGCKVTFTHTLNRKKGTDKRKVAYSVKRTSNKQSVVDNKTISSGDSSGGTWTDTVTLYPGMTVCETLKFKIYSNKNDEASIPVCVKAEGKPVSSLLKIQVKNYDAPKYNAYQDAVFAKPGDRLSYKANYRSGAQALYNDTLIPEKIKVGGTTCPSGNTVNTSKTLKELFNSCVSPGWNNAFSTQLLGARAVAAEHYKYDVGNDGAKEEINDKYDNVQMGDVGEYVEGKAIINLVNTTKNTPLDVKYEMVNGVNVGVVDVDEQVSAFAYVPYNFVTSVKITTEPTKDNGEVNPFFAGERARVKYEISIKKKTNSETTGGTQEEAYTTRADDVKRQLIIYNPATVSDPRRAGGVWPGGRTGNPCAFFGYDTGRGDASCGLSDELTSDMNPGDGYEQQGQFYVQDLPAGATVCVAAAVFPASSGLDTNWNNKNYSNSWRISNSKCFVVAKRPSLQVWGGNVYSRGGISTAVSEKYNLAEINNYYVGLKSGNNVARVFGSWGELGVIATGGVSGFASGAATGYEGSNNLADSVWPKVNISGSVGGTSQTTFCYRSRLTFSNYPCSMIGAIGTNANNNKASGDKTIITDILARSDEEGGLYQYSDDDISLDGMTIGTAGVTEVIRSKKDVVINGDLVYDGTYKTFADVPKLVIYGKNIKINCGVGRIDALLIADEVVNTCVDEVGNEIEDVNDARRSNQLIINGAVIADKMVADRTYGAGVGVNSITPAEIINFDPTLYRFGGGTAEVSDDTTGRLDVTYMHELAPRR